jgi:hypothetical protein
MRKDKNLMFVGLILSLFFVIVGSVWLSQSTETLDVVAEHFGVETTSIWNPPIPDYEISGYEGNIPINIIVGIVFTLLVFGVTLAVGKGLRAPTKIKNGV